MKRGERCSTVIVTYLFWCPVPFPDIVAVFQKLQDLLDRGLLFLQLLHLETLATSSRQLAHGLFCLLHEFDIFYPQLLADDVQISRWVDIALDVDDLGVVEASDDLEDSIDSSNV